MFIFLIIGAIFLLRFLLPSMDGPTYTGKKTCDSHKWQYNDSGFLQCQICRKLPGEEYTPRD